MNFDPPYNTKSAFDHYDDNLEHSQWLTMLVEYKGEQIRGMAKEIDKAQVGKLWAESSAGRCLFAFVYRHESGMSMPQQLDAVLTWRVSLRRARPRRTKSFHRVVGAPCVIC